MDGIISTKSNKINLLESHEIKSTSNKINLWAYITQNAQ